MNVWELLLKLMFAVPPLGVVLIAAALKLVAKQPALEDFDLAVAESPYPIG